MLIFKKILMKSGILLIFPRPVSVLFALALSVLPPSRPAWLPHLDQRCWQRLQRVQENLRILADHWQSGGYSWTKRLRTAGQPALLLLGRAPSPQTIGSRQTAQGNLSTTSRILFRRRNQRLITAACWLIATARPTKQNWGKIFLCQWFAAKMPVSAYRMKWYKLLAMKGRSTKDKVCFVFQKFVSLITE